MAKRRSTRYTPERSSSQEKEQTDGAKSSPNVNRHGFIDKDKDPDNEITQPGPDENGEYAIYKILKSITNPATGKINKVKVHRKGWNSEDCSDERVCDVRDTEAYQEWRKVWEQGNEEGVFEVEDIDGQKEVKGELWVRVWYAGRKRKHAEWQPATLMKEL